MIKGAVMNEHKKHGSSFSSKMGFILAAAGSAVGLGNLWGFPYLAAKYGGGSFLLIYVILAVTFGFALMITEIALGRKTGKSALYAFSTLHEKCGFIGILASIVPIIILPYYCVIGDGSSNLHGHFLQEAEMQRQQMIIFQILLQGPGNW